MRTRKIAALLVALSLTISAGWMGAVVSGSPGHHDEGPEHGQQRKSKKEERPSQAREPAVSEASTGTVFGSPEAPRDIAISMTDTLRFDPGTIVVSAGETIRFLLDNPTTALHDFTLGDLDAQEHHHAEMAAGGGHMHDADSSEHGLPGPVVVEPGESVEVVATFDEAGELLVGCHVPGHWEAGMRGSVVVLGEGAPSLAAIRSAAG